MWHNNYRAEALRAIDKPWDMVVVGGGIVGAAIMREAARLGLRVLLVEQRDFAWGTSSRSSKFVHGGLRYLKTLDLRTTFESVRDRKLLMADARELIDPIDFLLTRHRGDKPGALGYEAALTVYDLMAGQRTHRRYSLAELKQMVPDMDDTNLIDSYACAEAMTDDARLTLRVLGEGVAAGGTALSYVRAEQLLRAGGEVTGIVLRDMIAECEFEVPTRLVINATGAWADQLRGSHDGTHTIRPLRGSHLVFPGERLPLTHVVSINHPIDRRPVTVAPWQGVTIVGNTDLDHHGSLTDEPQMVPNEVSYLMAIVDFAFPRLNLSAQDAISCYTGVRPVVNTGKADPSKESREHLIRFENGLLTVTGGKLTTFHSMAESALRAIPGERLKVAVRRSGPTLDPVRVDPPGSAAVRARLLARYGNLATTAAADTRAGELEFIPGTRALWMEVKWAARSEAVMHLDDLMLRRVPLGLLLPEGGQTLLPKIRALCQPELGWSDERWRSEQERYRDLWRRCYCPPAPAAKSQ